MENDDSYTGNDKKAKQKQQQKTPGKTLKCFRKGYVSVT